MRHHLWTLCLGALVTSCGFLPSQEGRCDLRPKSPQCTDIRNFVGPSLITFESVCNSLIAASDNQGTYTSNARCDSDKALGGCQTKNADGSKQTNWYYQSDKYPDVAAVQAKCDDGEFVTE